MVNDSLSAKMVSSEMMSLLGENQTKPKDVEMVAWSVVATVRQTTVPCADPATTTEHTVRPTISPYRIRLG